MSRLVVYLLILCIGIAPHAQESEWETLCEEVMPLYSQCRYDDAVVVAKKALRVATQADGPNHPSVATSLKTLHCFMKPKANMHRPSRSTSEPEQPRVSVQIPRQVRAGRATL
jgi:hypothetical protein